MFPVCSWIDVIIIDDIVSLVYRLICRFCANYLYSSIETSINTSPYKEESERRTRSYSISRRDRRQGVGFLREMDIVNGFQLCDAHYRGVGWQGMFIHMIDKSWYCVLERE